MPITDHYFLIRSVPGNQIDAQTKFFQEAHTHGVEKRHDTVRLQWYEGGKHFLHEDRDVITKKVTLSIATTTTSNSCNNLTRT